MRAHARAAVQRGRQGQRTDLFVRPHEFLCDPILLVCGRAVVLILERLEGLRDLGELNVQLLVLAVLALEGAGVRVTVSVTVTVTVRLRLRVRARARLTFNPNPTLTLTSSGRGRPSH